ncbi:MAG: glutamine-hydrolyzing carbamoyl-phosphate synthase small subunit, partial [Deltaproteobacteria bacterium]|nr:glutamine-hydrolyzing carbamoyl-phosphate synthase small subunit [Deltaproteobacteria bacterium]
MEGLLVLSNGRVFKGRLRGAQTAASGEVIFNTALTGYQEILTDPSYAGQIVTMTYPHIGNYGINPEDVESRKPFIGGFIVKELSRVVSNWRATESLESYFKRHGIPVLEGLDTRALVIALRDQGSLPGLIVPAEGADLDALRKQAAALPGMEGQNLARTVSADKPYAWNEPAPTKMLGQSLGQSLGPSRPGLKPRKPFKVVAYDFGIKYNILRMLVSHGAQVEVVPSHTPAPEVLARNPDGVFLSNGPGDPEPVLEAIASVKELLGQVPIFGICLGHQILGIALGARSYKLKFGHHGANHPVQELDSGKIEITSQNHGFALKEDTLPKDVRVTHRSLNDETVEGIESSRHPAFSVQYHPEAAPGPHDSHYLFQRFNELMER